MANEDRVSTCDRQSSIRARRASRPCEKPHFGLQRRKPNSTYFDDKSDGEGLRFGYMFITFGKLFHAWCGVSFCYGGGTDQMSLSN